MFRLYRATDVPEAHIVIHMLTEAGIEATVVHENVGGALGELPSTWPEVWLRFAHDEPRARDIIARYEAALAAPGAPQRCNDCGEENPGNFELCWHCGAGLA